MSHILTIDGPGRLLEISSSRNGTSYRVSGKGFEGWYASHEIMSELDDDETTTSIPFTNDSDSSDNSTLVPDDDPAAAEGVTLPWNPQPTAEWGMGVDDGGLTQQPDGADVDLTPSKSTKGIDLSEDPESSERVYGAVGTRGNEINWHSPNEGSLSTGHQISLDDSEPDHASWTIHDGKGNAVAVGEHHAIHGPGSALTDDDWDAISAKTQEDADDVARHHTSMKRAAYREYENLLERDEMVREAAWADVRRKASRLFKNGNVRVEKLTPREIFAKVDGDSGTYNTQVHRKNAFGQGITYWACNCGWGNNAYLRQRTFIGRQCSHAYATYMAMQAKQVPVNKNRKINDTTERHSLGAQTYPGTGSGEHPSDYGFDPADHDRPIKLRPENVHTDDDPFNAPKSPANHYVRSSAFNPGQDSEDEYVPYVKRESLAAKQAGLMVWDDDLAKVMKQIYNQQPPGGATAPVDPGAAAGVPTGLGASPADMGAPGASPMSADPSMDNTVDPSQGDPNGAGVDPSMATPPFVRNVTGPTAQDPTGNQVTSSIFEDSQRLQHYKSLDPATQSMIMPRPSVGEIMSGGGPQRLQAWRQHYDNFMQTGEIPPQIARTSSFDSSYPVRVQRFHHAEFTDGNPDDNFEEWGDPNSEDADTFNTVQDLTDDNDPEEAFYDDFYGRSSSNHYSDDMSMPQDPSQDPSMQTDPSVSDPAPGQDINTPAVPSDSLPIVPRSTSQAPLQAQSTTIDSSLNYLLADNDDSSDFSYQEDPDFAQTAKDDDDYDEDDAHYDNNEEDNNGKTSSIQDWFESDGSEYKNRKEAERFNDDANDIVREFQRTAGRQFSYSEQQDLIDENPDARASQFDSLNLKNSFYENQPF